jgi:hypothetical protein
MHCPEHTNSFYEREAPLESCSLNENEFSINLNAIIKGNSDMM